MAIHQSRLIYRHVCRGREGEYYVRETATNRTDTKTVHRDHGRDCNWVSVRCERTRNDIS